jgi:hypothetical protein
MLVTQINYLQKIKNPTVMLKSPGACVKPILDKTFLEKFSKERSKNGTYHQ